MEDISEDIKKLDDVLKTENETVSILCVYIYLKNNLFDLIILFIYYVFLDVKLHVLIKRYKITFSVKKSQYMVSLFYNVFT